MQALPGDMQRALKRWRLQAPDPQVFKINFDLLEGLYSHLFVFSKAARQGPSAVRSESDP